MKKIYWIGDIVNNTGPAIVNKSYKEYLNQEAIFCETNNKLYRIFHFLLYLLFIDVVLVSGFSKLNYLLVMIAKLLDKDVCYLMHGYIKEESKYHEGDFTKKIEMEYKLLSQVDKIICVSKNFSNIVKSDLLEFKDKIYYVNNGVELYNSYSKKEINNQEYTIISVGGGKKIKNNLAICKAIKKAKLKNIRFIIIGDKAEDGKKIIKYPFVEYYDKLTHEEVIEKMENADLYIQNSYLETFGLAVLEGLNSGCDILISKNVGCIPILENLDSNDIIDNPSDLMEISSKIVKKIKNKDKKQITYDKEKCSYKNRSLELLNLINQKKSSQIKKDKMALHIACLVILMNSFQLGLNFLGLKFNMFFIEFFLLLILFIINKFKIKNFSNLILIIVSFIIFLINVIFYSNDFLFYYLYQFIIYALPLLILFLFEFDFKELSKLFYKYSIFIVILYLLNILFKANLLKDYMSFGYNGMFSATYVIIYSIIKSKKTGIIFAIISAILFLIFGSRATILIFIAGAFFTYLFKSKNQKKLFLIVSSFIIVFLVLLKSGILLNFSDYLRRVFGSHSYFLRQINNMLKSTTLKEMLGIRYSIYEKSLMEISNHPLLGIGIGTFESRHEYFVHNLFLDVYTTFGLIFGSFYLLFLINLIKKVYKIALKDTSIKIFFIFCIAIIFKLLFSKTFIYDPYIWLLLAMFLNINKKGKVNCER